MTTLLGIETSCDETSAAVVQDGRTILSLVIASQADFHARYGGVFPEMASRMHIEAIHPVITQALEQAHGSLDEIDAIAVTRGPGLAGSLVVGMNAAKGLALGRGLPLIGVSHLEGHLYSLWLVEGAEQTQFPVMCLIVSGGHTELVLMTDHLHYRRLGGTIDDAAGEAFDKVGRMLGLPYPGGPYIEKAAREGNPAAFAFPRAWLEGAHDFSFSGLKTAVLRELKRQAPDSHPGEAAPPPNTPIADLAASFQAAAVEVLAVKTVAAARVHGATAIFMAGGVSANKALRAEMEKRAGDLPVRFPPLILCADNAAMIAAAGHWRFLAGHRDSLAMDVKPNWKLT
ncbi:MAG: tRNA (adenosine(37)-N6)-threonylcarbamoyltransferase complex transferase subunit TsaD [Chloroflexi bacterium]|nr:tRNA (adenosine(37)-N6)-threonylcarbamoyltransferase complex transferase subunit TsaD [Chloroflexota bacterium]